MTSTETKPNRAACQRIAEDEWLKMSREQRANLGSGVDFIAARCDELMGIAPKPVLKLVTDKVFIGTSVSDFQNYQVTVEYATDPDSTDDVAREAKRLWDSVYSPSGNKTMWIQGPDGSVACSSEQEVYQVLLARKRQMFDRAREQDQKIKEGEDGFAGTAPPSPIPGGYEELVRGWREGVTIKN